MAGLVDGIKLPNWWRSDKPQVCSHCGHVTPVGEHCLRNERLDAVYCGFSCWHAAVESAVVDGLLADLATDDKGGARCQHDDQCNTHLIPPGRCTCGETARVERRTGWGWIVRWNDAQSEPLETQDLAERAADWCNTHNVWFDERDIDADYRNGRFYAKQGTD